MPSDCPFCDLDNVTGVVRLGQFVVRFPPLDPVTPGHMLFVPITHVESAAAGPATTASVMARAASYGAEQGNPFNLITSVGAAATQTVRHLHVHYVPRRPDDDLALPWTGQRDRDAAQRALDTIRADLHYDHEHGGGWVAPKVRAALDTYDRETRGPR